MTGLWLPPRRMMMGPGARLLWALAAPALVVVSTPSAHAQLSVAQVQCFKAIGNAGARFAKGTLRLKQKCRESQLKEPVGGCASPDTDKLQGEITKLNKKLTKSCFGSLSTSGQVANLTNMGFPGPCSDTTSMDGFTTADLQSCIQSSHQSILDQLYAIEYDVSLTGPLSAGDLACQKEVGKQGGALLRCILKNVQKCRNRILSETLKGISPSILADDCATKDLTTANAIAKCVRSLRDKVSGPKGKCTDGEAVSLKLCTPDQSTAPLAADCIVSSHTLLADTPAIDVPVDLIDSEYATRGGICGDGRVNSLDEECDGACPGGACTDNVCVGGSDDGKSCDDSACPGECGTARTPDGYFACLCKTNHRQRVIEHANADLDNGWTGTSHDSGIVEGGGYVADLYDCVGDVCNVGPHCSSGAHSPCAVPAEHSSCIGGANEGNNCDVATECPGGICASAASGTTGDSICAALGQGTCRKTRVAVGPHCYKDLQKKCNPKLTPSDPICNAPGDFCEKQFHGPPLPLSSGGISVCIVNVFTEDVVGTSNLITGDGVQRLRQNSVTHSSAASGNAPCPVCGGFCAASRERCSVDADCPEVTGPCVTALVCSNGPNKDKACRLTPPFGGTTALFGSTSVDCPPFPAADLSGGGLDILFNPATTGVTTRIPSVACDAQGFTNNVCFGGTEEGKPCPPALCLGGGACKPQCYCPNGGPTRQRPNGCDPACLGGDNDASSCDDDSECPGGFCHIADCRLDAGDTASCQEGTCTTGPFLNHCSISVQQPCDPAHGDFDCQGGCASCHPGETCATEPRPCFVNVNGGVGIKRCGTPGPIDHVSATLFCIPPITKPSAINLVTGLPGLGAITQPVTTIECPGGINCP